MTQTIALQELLYDRDLDLWLETTIAQLKAGDFYNLDIENLIEELEGLSGSNKRKIEYPDHQIPDKWQFGSDVDTILNIDFWEESQ